MTKIHHATLKRAKDNGVILTVEHVKDKDGFETGDAFYKAFWPQENQTIFGSDPKWALDAMLLKKTIRAEYPNIDVKTTIHNDTYVIDAIGHVSDEDEETAQVFKRFEKVPTIGEVTELAIDKGVDPEIGYEEPEVRVVVPAKYKEEYAKRGNRNHCGDWLAQELDGVFTIGQEVEGKSVDVFDHVAFAEMLEANGVDMTGKWANLPNSGQKGWQGRYRMNGRQKLEKVLATTGVLVYADGTKVELPIDYLKELVAKHPVPVEKEDKQAA